MNPDTPSTNPTTAPASTSTPKRLALAIQTLAALALLFAGAMARDVTYDEDQYLAAGYMVAKGLLPYRDFVYLQPPLYPFILGAAFKLSGGWYLLTGRLLTFGLGAIGGAFLWATLRRLGAGLALATVLMAACLSSPFLASTLSNTRNDALPLALMLAGLWLHLRSIDRGWWGQATAALLLGLAVEAKLTYLFGPLAIGLHALGAPRTRLPPILLGTALAALPAALFWILAPDSLRFGLLDYHLTAPADWYGRQNLPEALELGTRLAALQDWFLLGGNLTLLALSAALCLVAMARRRKWKRPGPLLLGMLCGALILAVVPAPAWAMYFAPVAPLLACCIAHLDRTTIHLANPTKKRILFAVTGLACIPVLALQLGDIAHLRHRQGWAGLAAHDAARAATAAMPAPGEIATLFPHLTMDTSPPRPDLAAGPFLFRSPAAVPPPLAAKLHALTPATIDEAFAAHPPAAIMTGPFASTWRIPMDQPLADWAQSHGWRRLPLTPPTTLLWLPPS